MRMRSYYFWLAVALVIVMISASMITIWGAWQDRSGRIARLSILAEHLSSQLDSEVYKTEARLIGLASSPLLMTGDIRTFHEQMLRLPIPDGTSLVLSDRRGQLANRLRPYGAPLPLLSEYRPQPYFFEILERDGLYVSSKVYGKILDKTYVTVSIKVPDEDGHLKYIMTSAIDDGRLLSILQSSGLPADARLQLVDFMGEDLADWNNGDVPAVALPQRSGLTPESFGLGASGIFQTDGAPRLMTAFHRSALTGWTVGLTQTRAMIDYPLNRAMKLLALFALGMATLLLGLFYLFRTQIQRPFNAMETLLTVTRSEVSSLTSGLAVARSEEQGRIAQELHDTTAQRLVAAKLSLQRLGRHSLDQKLTLQIHEVQALIAQSLDELRTFAFLLHTPRPGVPFSLTLRDLVEGFASRARLDCVLDLPAELDHLTEEQQHALYSITQEALANIHRHASASGIWVRVECLDQCFVLVVEDDGRGGVAFPSPGGQRPGLGIIGIQRKLSEIGGQLSIEPRQPGTRVVAHLPRLGPDRPAGTACCPIL